MGNLPLDSMAAPSRYSALWLRSSAHAGLSHRAAILLTIVLAATVFSASCGYQVAGKSAHLPSEWKTIAIPAFTNDTTRYRIEQRMTEAVIREFLSRTKYRVVSTGPADAVLHGEVTSIETVPLLFDRSEERRVGKEC